MIKLKFWIYSLLAVVLVAALFAFTAKFFLADLQRASSARLERAVVRLAQAQTQRQADELAYARSLAELPAVVEAVQAARRLSASPPTSGVTRAQEAIAEASLPAGVRPAIEVVFSTPGGASRSRVGEPVEEGTSTEAFAWLTAVHAGDARSTMTAVGEGNILAVASAPIEAAGEPLGAITLFFPVDAGLLASLRSQVGVEVTVARGQAIVASSGELNDAGSVAAATREASPDDAVSWGASDELLILPYLAQALALTVPEGYARKVPLPGVADAVLIATVGVHDSVAAFDEISLYWAGGAASLLLLSLIWGFFVAAGAGGKWARRLTADLERSASGDTAHRLEPRRYSRAFRPVAEAINAALEGTSSRSPGLADQVMVHRDADIGSVLGDHAPAEGAAPDDFGFPGDAPADDAGIEPVMPGDLPQVGDEAPASPSDAGFDPFSEPAAAPEPAPALAPEPMDPPAPPADAGFDPFSEPAAPEPMAAGGPPPPPPEATGGFDPFAEPAAPAPAPAAAPPPAAPPAAADPFASEMSSEPEGDYFSDSTRVVNLNDMAAQAQAAVADSPADPPAAAADPFAAAYGEDNLGPEEEGPDATVVAKVPDALLAATARAQGGGGAAARDPDEEHFKQVFQDFVTTRQQCGEGSDGLTFEKFAAKLKKNRDTIKGKHGARSVRFQVYVKAGKAALKATPVK